MKHRRTQDFFQGDVLALHPGRDAAPALKKKVAERHLPTVTSLTSEQAKKKKKKKKKKKGLDTPNTPPPPPPPGTRME